jgi:hypothetical protein
MSKLSDLTKRAIELDKERAQITREIKKEATRLEKEREKQNKRLSPPKHEKTYRIDSSDDDIVPTKMKRTTTQPSIKAQAPRKRRVIHEDDE